MRNVCQSVDGICSQCGKPVTSVRYCAAGPMAHKVKTPRPREAMLISPTPPGLGDRIESALTAIGITQERWKATKAAIGLPPTCNCDERKAGINTAEQWVKELGSRLGNSAVDAISSFFRPLTPKAKPDPPPPNVPLA